MRYPILVLTALVAMSAATPAFGAAAAFFTQGTPVVTGGSQVTDNVKGNADSSGFIIGGASTYKSDGSPTMTITYTADLVFSTDFRNPFGAPPIGEYILIAGEFGTFNTSPTTSATLSQFTNETRLNFGSSNGPLIADVIAGSPLANGTPVSLRGPNQNQLIESAVAVSFPFFYDGSSTVDLHMLTTITFSGLGANETVTFDLPSDSDLQAVPEPATMSLLGMAAVSFVGYFGWRRRKQPILAT